MVLLATQAAVVEGSGEFCNIRRRAAHVLTMYGFILYVGTTIIMVFSYPTPPRSTPDASSRFSAAMFTVPRRVVSGTFRRAFCRALRRHFAKEIIRLT